MAFEFGSEEFRQSGEIIDGAESEANMAARKSTLSAFLVGCVLALIGWLLIPRVYDEWLGSHLRRRFPNARCYYGTTRKHSPSNALNVVMTKASGFFGNRLVYSMDTCYLAGSSLCDDDIATLQRFSHLRFLNLSETNITDKQLLAIVASLDLIDLQLFGTAVSDEAIREAKAIKPEITIRR